MTPGPVRDFAFGKKEAKGRIVNADVARALVTLACVIGAVHATAQAPMLEAPNVVEISPRLVTSGQPSAKALGTLKALRFDAVIDVASPTAPDSVADEPQIVTAQGLAYVDIPINFDEPSEADFETFAAVLGALSKRKVLVHCRANFRASTLVFLYRAVVLKEDPHKAFEAVSGVWSPSPPWRKLVEEQLRKHNVAFEIF